MTSFEQVLEDYRSLGIDKQIDYQKFYLYSIITHSTAIEGSTITELENQIMFDQNVSLKGKSLMEMQMNLDLKRAYEKSLQNARDHSPITPVMLKELSSIVMYNTGNEYNTALGNFSARKGDYRLCGVTAGVGGKSYMNFQKIPYKVEELCQYLNNCRQQSGSMSVHEKYNFTFDSHYLLAHIHPWVDGNGRMARLLMNQLQFEMDLIPTKILKEDKEEYIKALVKTTEEEDLTVFRKYMTESMANNLRREIEIFKEDSKKNIDLGLNDNITDSVVIKQGIGSAIKYKLNDEWIDGIKISSEDLEKYSSGLITPKELAVKYHKAAGQSTMNKARGIK